MRNQSLDRTLRLLNALRSGRWPLRDLATQLGVTTRTIRRDIEVLSAAGFQIEQECRTDDDRPRWFVSRDGRCPLCERV